MLNSGNEDGDGAVVERESVCDSERGKCRGKK